ncbi:MAG TPA: biopolymer transporter ExbD [Rectinemataceae bacterium]|nr:biopolymer transporter ExbD [Rectinemataceae bacterium]
MRSGRRLHPATNVNLVPLIDVLLILIIFFMITTTFKVAPGISLTLPSSSTSQNVQSSVVSVVAVSESEIYVDRVRTTLAGLPALIKRKASSGDPSTIKATLEGDKSASYQLMISVLDALRRNGIEAVGLRTRPVGGGP